MFLLVFPSLNVCQSPDTPGTTINLDIPATPTGNPQIIDGSFQSFSIEFAYMADYGGNLRQADDLVVQGFERS